ncbi:MAG: hypothetical protein K2X01_11875 [Cyanobacteria bacterium]|nr:hypothetical protein [Cyanobacteriota bacterium]
MDLSHLQPFNLDALNVASPCPANWEEMTGDDRVRFCNSCQLNVYHLSGMTRLEAEMLIQEKEGKLCVRYYRRADGTILTKDCPLGLSIRYSKKIQAPKINTGWKKTAAAAVLVATVLGSYTVSLAKSPNGTQAVQLQNQQRTVTGGMMPMPPSRNVMGDVAFPEPKILPVQGNMVPAKPSKPETPTTPSLPPTAKMGEMLIKQPSETGRIKLMGKPLMAPTGQPTTPLMGAPVANPVPPKKIKKSKP